MPVLAIAIWFVYCYKKKRYNNETIIMNIHVKLMNNPAAGTTLSTDINQYNRDLALQIIFSTYQKKTTRRERTYG